VRTYKTTSGTYSEADLAVVVWRNPQKNVSNQVRYLETMTSETSSLPMVFPIESLKADRAWKTAKFAKDSTDLVNKIHSTSRRDPLIVPIPLAKAFFGWEDFFIPSEYTS
jgi:hypothetical protein